MDIVKLIELYPDLRSVPNETTPVPETFSQNGFFPVCRGRFGNTEESPVDLIIVGQDFGTQDTMAGAHSCGERWPEEFGQLATWLRAADIDYSRCFFTNSILCVRSGERLSGKPSPAWRNSQYLEACAKAFVHVLDAMAPKGVVFCGAPNLRFAQLLGVPVADQKKGYLSLSAVYAAKAQLLPKSSIGMWKGCVAFSPHWSNPGNLRNPRNRFTAEDVLKTWGTLGPHIHGESARSAQQF